MHCGLHALWPLCTMHTLCHARSIHIVFCTEFDGQACHLLLSTGALPSLVALLKSADHEIQAKAAGVMLLLSGGIQQNVDAIISAGVLWCLAHRCRCEQACTSKIHESERRCCHTLAHHLHMQMSLIAGCCRHVNSRYVDSERVMLCWSRLQAVIALSCTINTLCPVTLPYVSCPVWNHQSGQ